MISCSTNPNCKMIDECDKKIDCTTYMELSEGKRRYICGCSPCKYSNQANNSSQYSKVGRKGCIVEMEELYGAEATTMFCLTNSYKYLCRAGDKFGNPARQDFDKAKWYFDYTNKLIEKYETLTFNGTRIEDTNLYLDIKEMLENE